MEYDDFFYSYLIQRYDGLTAYRHLETYAPDTGEGMLLIHLQPPFSVMQDDLRWGRAKMTR